MTYRPNTGRWRNKKHYTKTVRHLLSLFVPILISLTHSPDQLVITKHRHTTTTRTPVLIKVNPRSE